MAVLREFNFLIKIQKQKIFTKLKQWFNDVRNNYLNFLDLNNNTIGQKEQYFSMLESVLASSKPIYCYRHKKQLVTHLCTDLKCNNNPILCSQCMSQGVNRSYHYDHYEKSVCPLPEALQYLSQSIKNQLSPMQRIYKSTLGRGDFALISFQLEKGSSVVQQLDNRISTIKSQIELQLELLVKQFQRIVLVEKQQYFKMLQNYQKIFTKNTEYLQNQTQSLVDFQNSIKYFSNKNNLYLKIASEINRKTDWFIKTKKNLQVNAKNMDNLNFSSELNSILSLSSRIKLDIWPTWKGQDLLEKSNDFRYWIKRALNQWVYIPQLKSIQQELQMLAMGTGSQGLGIGSNGNIKNYYIQSQNTIK